jgi:aminoglycoside phosphotransferase (APT) family kinase protein
MAWSIQTWLAARRRRPLWRARRRSQVTSRRSSRRCGRHRREAVGSPGQVAAAICAHDDWVETCLSRSKHLVDVQALRALWGRLRATSRHRSDRMTHGDLTPWNLLVADGRLVGVLDSGGFGPADPALDLVVAWHLLDDAREVFRDALDCDEAEWERGKAWAFEQALGAAWYYEGTNPAMHEMGMTTLRRLLASEG